MEKQGEIVLYQPDETVRLEVRLDEDTVWLNRQQLAMLFGRDVKTIGKHVVNALKEELSGMATVAKFATVQKEGGRDVVRQVEYYNLDMILSVGYRVKSRRGVEFRQWANKVLKEYLLKGYAINRRLADLESRVDAKFLRHEQRLDRIEEKVDFFVRTSLPPVEGVFYSGQIFDAYMFVSGLIKSANKTVVLIDNYIDESVLMMLGKRNPGVTALIYTRKADRQLQLDIEKYNSQYEPVEVVECRDCHDRFMIVDGVVYHIGASLKDLGKKLFAFSKLEIPAAVIMSLLHSTGVLPCSRSFSGVNRGGGSKTRRGCPIHRVTVKAKV